MAATKVRTGVRQELADDTMEATAMRGLAASALDDPGLFGMAALLLASRPCRVSCGPSGRQPGRLREPI